jgi:ATP-dependent RNA helicase DeaD
MMKFDEMGLSQEMMNAIERKGFDTPTPVQAEIIPLMLKEKCDLTVQAQTGTGKTAAFGIPVLESIESFNGDTKVLIMAPTRELAIQVAGEVKSLAKGKKAKVLAVYGGQSFVPQLKGLKDGTDIVVGTPGRILDHIKRGTLNLEKIEYLILDEADEMLDMGFIEDIETIISKCPPQRQTLLFSATMPRQIISIAKKYMKNVKSIAVGQTVKTPIQTIQVYYDVRGEDKTELISRIIDVNPDFYGLVFCRTRIETAGLAASLEAKGYKTSGIHGDIDQTQRERIMNKFRSREVTILVATDVAARGIDVRDLTHVINFHVPQNNDTYVHRIGRTGRAGREGTAITFVEPRERRELDMIRHASGGALKKGRVPSVDEIMSVRFKGIKEILEQAISKPEETSHYSKLAAELIESHSSEEVVAACLKHAFADVLDPHRYREIQETKVASPSHANVRLFVAQGRSHGLNPKKLIQMIADKTGVRDRLLQNLEMFENFSFVNVPTAEAGIIQNRFKQKQGKPLISIAKPSDGPKKDDSRGFVKKRHPSERFRK